MLKFNFDRLFVARGITRKYVFLLNAGFGNHQSRKIKNNTASTENVTDQAN